MQSRLIQVPQEFKIVQYVRFLPRLCIPFSRTIARKMTLGQPNELYFCTAAEQNCFIQLSIKLSHPRNSFFVTIESITLSSISCKPLGCRSDKIKQTDPRRQHYYPIPDSQSAISTTILYLPTTKPSSSLTAIKDVCLHFPKSDVNRL